MFSFSSLDISANNVFNVAFFSFELSSEPRLDAILSISSKNNTTLSSDSLASTNIFLMLLAVWFWYLEPISPNDIFLNSASIILEKAFAIYVFPVPGTPCNNIALIGFISKYLYLSGLLNWSITSNNFSFTSCIPATSSNVIPFFSFIGTLLIVGDNVSVFLLITFLLPFFSLYCLYPSFALLYLAFKLSLSLVDLFLCVFKYSLSCSITAIKSLIIPFDNSNAKLYFDSHLLAHGTTNW